MKPEVLGADAGLVKTRQALRESTVSQIEWMLLEMAVVGDRDGVVVETGYAPNEGFAEWVGSGPEKSFAVDGWVKWNTERHAYPYIRCVRVQKKPC